MHAYTWRLQGAGITGIYTYLGFLMLRACPTGPIIECILVVAGLLTGHEKDPRQVARS